MDLPVRKKIPHIVPQWVSDGSWFFITIKCVPPGKNQLCQAGVGEGILAAMAYNHKKLVWHCRLCLLMPDHLHGIIAFPREPGMATTIRNWKKFTTIKHGIEWQRDFFDHRLRDRHDLLHPDESGAKGVMRTDGRLDLGVSPGGSSAGIVGINRLW